MATETINVPDIGDFKDVDVIDVLVAVGDGITEEQSLISLETDKAVMDVPAPSAGKITELKVKAGDKVSQGDAIAVIETEAEKSTEEPKEEKSKDSEPAEKESEAKSESETQSEPDQPEHNYDCDVAVIGAGPGGYTAAFRAADLGLKVTLIERHPSLGGVCLNVGCIPSKALLHAAKVIDEADEMEANGVSFGKPQIDIDKLRGWKEKVVGTLTGGLDGLAKKRSVNVVHGVAEFTSDHELTIKNDDDEQALSFANCIIAAGSEAVEIPDWPHDDDRVMTSTGALKLADIPKSLLVVGGGIIGLEMATVYQALGAKISVVELMDGLIPGCDRDLVKPLHKRIADRYENIWLSTKVAGMAAKEDGIHVQFEGDDAPDETVFDRVLVSVGRKPIGNRLSLEAAGINVNDRGFVEVDTQQRTNISHIFAIGDTVPGPGLAHKATHEGKTAAEAIAGEHAHFDARCIPSVAYTDPEVAWVGVTETQANEKGIAYEKGEFPWAASGRALSVDRKEGKTKLLFDPETERVIGGGIVGPNAGELIAEIGLAIEMGGDCHDIGLTLHAHPTLSETVAFSADAMAGSLTDLYTPKRKKQ